MKQLKSVSVAILATICLVFSACNNQNTNGNGNKPTDPTEGNKVIVNFEKITQDTIVINFKKETNVMKYSFIILEEGTMQDQIDQFGPMFGFSDAEGYLNMFGAKATNDTTFTYPNMNPGFNYELFVMPTLKDSTNGEIATHKVTTLPQGGTGTAEVTIEIGGFRVDSVPQISETNDTTYDYFYNQTLSVYPNEECALYRYFLINKDSFDIKWTDEKAIEYLSNDDNPNFPGDPYWTLYKADIDAVWSLEPNTPYYVIAIGRNLNEEYGPLAKRDFATPDVARNNKKAKSVASRK